MDRPAEVFLRHQWPKGPPFFSFFELFKLFTFQMLLSAGSSDSFFIILPFLVILSLLSYEDKPGTLYKEIKRIIMCMQNTRTFIFFDEFITQKCIGRQEIKFIFLLLLKSGK